MNATIIRSVMEHLQANLPWLRWIDIEDGQLEMEGRPPVAFPCALIDVGYPQCETLTGGSERAKVSITFTLAFDGNTASNMAAPQEVRARAMERFAQMEELHRALQWWKPQGCLLPLRRESAMPDKRFAGIKVYNLSYATAIMP